MADKKRFRWLRGLMAFAVTGAIACPLLYMAAVTISPPRVEGHPVMPIGQLAFAIVFAPVIGAMSAYFFGRSR